MSLTALNSFGQTSVNYTEDRTARIIFDRTAATNQTAQTAQGLFHTVPVGIEIVDIIKPENINAYMEILIASVPTATVTLDTTPTGVTVESLGGGLHRIIPINSKDIWDQVKSPKITIPNTQSTNFTYTVSIKYDPSLTKSYTVTTTIVVYGIMSSVFVTDFTADVIPAVIVELASIFACNGSGLKVCFGNLEVASTLLLSAQALGIKQGSIDILSSASLFNNSGIIKFNQSNIASNFNILTTNSLLIKLGKSDNIGMFTTTATGKYAIATGRSSMTTSLQANATAQVISLTLEVISGSNGYIDPGLFRFNQSNSVCDVTYTNTNNGQTETFTNRTTSTNSSIFNFPNTTLGNNTKIKVEVKNKTGYADSLNIRNTNLVAIKNWGTLTSVTGNSTTDSSGLIEVPNKLTTNLTTLNFIRCTNLNDPNVINWDTSHLTSMNSMFENCYAFNQPIGNWNTSNVTTMTEMFAGLNGVMSFNQNIQNWNVSNVQSFSYMFANCTSFNQPLNNWQFGPVQSMDAMFKDCTSFNQPLNNWDIGTYAGRSMMFYNATSFVQDLSNWPPYTQASRQAKYFDYNCNSSWTNNLKPNYQGYNGNISNLDIPGNYLPNGNVDDFIYDQDVKFGTYSFQFNGVNRAYEYYSAHSKFLTDWTIELWFKSYDLTGRKNIISTRSSINDTVGLDLYTSGTNIVLDINNTTAIQGIAVATTDTWHHLAISKQGNNTRLFLNGSQIGSTYTTAYTFKIEYLCFGSRFAQVPNINDPTFESTNLYRGLLDDIRLSSTARYTSTYTVPTSALTKDANTRWLLAAEQVFVPQWNGSGNVFIGTLGSEP